MAVDRRRKKVDKRVKLYAYLPTVFMARLGKNEKLLLAFYAQNYNWTNQEDSYYSQAVICSYLGMAKGTYQKARKNLLKFGWITVTRESPQALVKIGVRLGVDDPAYDDFHWADWHPERQSKQNAIENFMDKHPDLIGEPGGKVARLWDTSAELTGASNEQPYSPASQLLVSPQDTNNEVNRFLATG
jgi:hypothetical protein